MIATIVWIYTGYHLEVIDLWRHIRVRSSFERDFNRVAREDRTRQNRLDQQTNAPEWIKLNDASLHATTLDYRILYPAVLVSATNEPPNNVCGENVTSVEPTSPFVSFPPLKSLRSCSPDKCWGLQKQKT